MTTGTLDEASSLFSFSDSSSDPFSSIGGDSDAALSGGSDALNPEQQQHEADTTPGLTWNANADGGQYATNAAPWSEVNSQNGQGNLAGDSAGYAHQQAYNPPTYDGHVDANSNVRAAHTTTSSTPYSYAPSTTPNAQANPYDPYTPSQTAYAQSTYGHATVPPPSHAYMAQHPGSSSSTYNPYPAYATTYSSSSSLPATGQTYDPYASMSGKVPPVAPPVPKGPTTDIYRPKDMSAYDPPLPPSKPRRTATNARVMSPPVSNQVYPGFVSPPTSFAQTQPPGPPPAQPNGYNVYNTPNPPQAPSHFTNATITSSAVHPPPPRTGSAAAHLPPPPRRQPSVPPPTSSHAVPPRSPTKSQLIGTVPQAKSPPSQVYTPPPVQAHSSAPFPPPPPRQPSLPDPAHHDSNLSQPPVTSISEAAVSTYTTAESAASIPSYNNADAFHHMPLANNHLASEVDIASHSHQLEELPARGLPEETSVESGDGRADRDDSDDVFAGDETFTQDDFHSQQEQISFTQETTFDHRTLPHEPTYGSLPQPSSIDSPTNEHGVMRSSFVLTEHMSEGHHDMPTAIPHPPPPLPPPASRSLTQLVSTSDEHANVVDKTRGYRPETPPAQTQYNNYSPSAASQRAKPVSARVASPAASIKSNTSNRSTYDPYAPPVHALQSQQARVRSMSNGSTYSTKSVSDTYTSSNYPQLVPPIPPPMHQPATHGFQHSQSAMTHTTDVATAGQTLSYSHPTPTPYAPSPSLIGANDILQRTSSRAPVISFGFGGKVVTCFHGSGTLNTGFDVALAARQTTNVTVRTLHKLIPQSLLEGGTATFPGPLLGDPGSPTTGLVRTGASTQVKNNKAKVIKYLDERADEMARGLNYLAQESQARGAAEARLILVRLLKVMIDNEGQLSGSAKLETAVRAALVDRLADETSDSPKSLLNGALSTLPSGTDLAMNSLGLGGDPSDPVLSTVTVRASALEKIQDHLVRGDRRAAVHYALDQRLWAHAMVIAGSIDRDAWKEVVNEFVKTELGESSVTSTGREGLKMVYSLFSGQGAASVKALVSPTKLSDGSARAPAYSLPISPNFPETVVQSPLPNESLTNWPETVAMMIPGPSATECSAALMALGDAMVASHWHEAAHVCYLLAPQSPVVPNLGAANARIVLLGLRNPLALPNFHVDHDPIIFSEIAEFAMALAPTTKGQEPFSGCAHLQSYKLIRAMHLAELGHTQTANRYCDAITSSLSRLAASSQLNPVFIEQLKEFTARLTAAPMIDKSGSWIGGKVNRPSLDSIGNWFEDRLTKFIAGDGEATTDAPQKPASFGPFAHYSTISSATSSKPSSPQPNIINPHVPSNAHLGPPRRTGSAQSVHLPFGPSLNTQVHIDRSSSALEYRPQARSSSPTPRIVSAGAVTTSFTQFPPYHGARNYPSGLKPVAPVPEGDGEQTAQPSNGNGNAGGGWWNSAYGDGNEDSTANPTPTAASFYNTEQPAADSGNFVSLMDAPSFDTLATTSSTQPRTVSTFDDEDDDLGLGNSSNSKKRPTERQHEDKSSSNSPTESNAVQPERPDPNPTQNAAAASSSSWFGRWWKRENTPGPIKATLGEESSFYYDKELKRWVNKKGGSDTQAPATPPPPPSRVQTASPGQTAARLPNGTSPTPPPPRAASSIDLTSPPKRMPPKARSNLVPTDAGTPPPPSHSPGPPQSGLTPPATPAMGRPRSQAGKRNIRSRYVDVFQNDAGAGA